jgi:hypothetical protein
VTGILKRGKEHKHNRSRRKNNDESSSEKWFVGSLRVEAGE